MYRKSTDKYFVEPSNFFNTVFTNLKVKWYKIIVYGWYFNCASSIPIALTYTIFFVFFYCVQDVFSIDA